MSRERSARKPVRILVADDHPLVRDALCALLKLQRGFTVVGEAADGVEAVQQLQALRPDVLLLDLSMPRMSGMDVLKELAATATSVKTIVLTGSIEPETTQEVLRLGAHGVVLKESSTTLLCKCVRAVMNGKVWVEPARNADPAQAVRPNDRTRAR